MSINLSDIRQTTNRYLADNVDVTIGPIIEPGVHVDPDEQFQFRIDATNNGGVRLINVKLRVWVEDEDVAKLLVIGDFIVPGGTFAQNVKRLNGGSVVGSPVSLGIPVEGFEIDFAPGHPWNAIGPNENLPQLTFLGLAGSNAGGGNTSIKARLIADIDRDYLFPKDRSSNATSRELNVFG